MEEWKEYKLGDVCKVINGRAYKHEELLDVGKYKVLRVGNIFQGNNWYYSDLELPEDKYCNKGDLLYAWSCGFAPYIWEGEKTIYHYHIWKLVENKKYVDRLFLYYYLIENTKFFLGGTHGSVMLHLTKGDFEQQLINLPQINIQRKIASILKSLDDKIEVNRRLNENLEQQAQALFKSWFVDFEPFKNGEFVESELGMIPKGWRVGTLNELCSFISRGLTPKYDDSSDELILGQTCVRNNIVTLNNARKHKPKSKTEKWVQKWDVLLNSTGIGSLGRVGIVYFQKDNVAIDSHITVVRTSSPLYRHYVGRNLLSRQMEIEKMAIGSTGQTELPRDSVKAMPIIIPSDNVMEKFNCNIEPMALAMYRSIEENSRLASLRDTLLPRLMSGELKVNEIENVL